jgi:hypothetical protein
MSVSLPCDLRAMSNDWLHYERIAALNCRDALWTERGSNANALAYQREATRIDDELACRRTGTRCETCHERPPYGHDHTQCLRCIDRLEHA